MTEKGNHTHAWCKSDHVRSIDRTRDHHVSYPEWLSLSRMSPSPSPIGWAGPRKNSAKGNLHSSISTGAEFMSRHVLPPGHRNSRENSWLIYHMMRTPARVNRFHLGSRFLDMHDFHCAWTKIALEMSSFTRSKQFRCTPGIYDKCLEIPNPDISVVVVTALYARNLSVMAKFKIHVPQVNAVLSLRLCSSRVLTHKPWYIKG